MVAALTEMGVQNTPWSQDGQAISDGTSMREAMEEASLDFGVETSTVMHRTSPLDVQELIQQHGYPTTDDELRAFCNAATSQQFTADNDHNVIRREDTNRVFGICGNRWEPLQNVDAFDWFQPAVDAEIVKLAHVGLLGGGKKVWILAELNYPPTEIIPGEEVAKYTILGNGHDGKTSIFVGFTPIRVWCANMFPMLRSNLATSLIRLRHTSRAKIQLDRLRDAMNYANAEFEATAEQYRELCRHTVNADDVETYVKQLLCDKADVDKTLADLSTRKRNVVEQVIGMTETGIGLQHAGVRGTWFAAFNAVNQYLNYNVGRSSNNRLNSLWFGQNRNLNDRALELALELAA
jgi:phage/plasmid-like protein (TIGR03299 family)